ncbi:hypothetical protein KCU61_g576, partial [Aureobasidium melanogenum]
MSTNLSSILYFKPSGICSDVTLRRESVRYGLRYPIPEKWSQPRPVGIPDPPMVVAVIDNSSIPDANGVISGCESTDTSPTCLAPTALERENAGTSKQGPGQVLTDPRNHSSSAGTKGRGIDMIISRYSPRLDRLGINSHGSRLHLFVHRLLGYCMAAGRVSPLTHPQAPTKPSPDKPSRNVIVICVPVGFIKF